MLINQKTMKSPMVSGLVAFNRLKANKGLTKALPEELWPLQPRSDDQCQDRCFRDFTNFPNGGESFFHPVVRGRVKWLLSHFFEVGVEY